MPFKSAKSPIAGEGKTPVLHLAVETALFPSAAPGEASQNGPRNTGPQLTTVCLYCHSACRRGGQDLPSDRWVTGLKHSNETRGFFAIRLGNPRNPFSVRKFKFFGRPGHCLRRRPPGLKPSYGQWLASRAACLHACWQLLPSASPTGSRCAELLGQRLRVVACLCRRPSPQLRILACVLICCASSGVQVIYVPAPVRETRLRACVSSGFPPANWPYMPPLLLRLSPLKSLSVTQLQRTTDALHTGRTRSMLTSCANA